MVGRHEAHLGARLEGTGKNADVTDDAAVGVKERIKDEGTQNTISLRGWGDTLHDGLQDLLDTDACLGAGRDRLIGRNRQEILQLLLHGGKVGIREVDLIDDRNDRETLLVGEVDVGHRLGLDTLGGIHDQKSTFAGGKAAGDFIGEVDMARGVHEIERVLLAVLGPVLHGDRVRLDRNPSLTLQIHGVEQLILLVAVGDGVGHLQQSVGKGGLSVVDVGDDAEVSDMRYGHGKLVNIVHRRKWVNHDTDAG